MLVSGRVQLQLCIIVAASHRNVQPSFLTIYEIMGVTYPHRNEASTCLGEHTQTLVLLKMLGTSYKNILLNGGFDGDESHGKK